MTASADFNANIDRFTGFADAYDKYRPQPPAILAEILTKIARAPRPALVVDLGSGTGLSARYWAGIAGQVIGVEPTPDMRRQAEALTQAGNITYREGFSHQTGLPDRCAQIVTCSQALHWMEPQATFEEARRILVPGGVFAAFDYDFPPTTASWEADSAFETCNRTVDLLMKQQPVTSLPRKLNKDQHLARMASSTCFRYTKEIVLHHTDGGNAARMIGLMFSQGTAQTLLKRGLTEHQLGIDTFRQVVQRTLGDAQETWYWSSRLRYGIV